MIILSKNVKGKISGLQREYTKGIKTKYASKQLTLMEEIDEKN